MIKWSEKLSSANLYQAMLHLVVLALAVVVFVLAKQNHELKSIGEQAERVDIKIGDPVLLGELIPVNTSNSVDSSKSQLLYFFTTKCPFCKQNIRFWEDLKQAVHDKRVFVAGVCMDATDKASRYAVENRITYDVYVPKDFTKFRDANHITSVPTTILRSPSGYADRVWIGLLHDEKMKEVAEAISVNQDPRITQRRQR